MWCTSMLMVITSSYIHVMIDTLTTDIFILYNYDSLILDQGPTLPKYALSTNAFIVTFVSIYYGYIISKRKHMFILHMLICTDVQGKARYVFIFI